MAGKLVGELLPAARILVLELNARRRRGVADRGLAHPHLLEPFCGGLGFLGELRPLVRRRAIAAAADDQRVRAIGVGEAEVQRGKPAHRKPDDVRTVELQCVENRLDVVAGAFLRIGVDAVRNIGGGKAASVVGDAAVALAEIPQLGLPRAAVASKFVHEYDRSAGADLFVTELHAVVGGEMRHSGLREVVSGVAQAVAMEPMKHWTHHESAASGRRWATACGTRACQVVMACTCRTRSSRARSVPARPTICTPTGMPLSSNPAGIATAGTPSMLTKRVHRLNA